MSETISRFIRENVNAIIHECFATHQNDIQPREKNEVYINWGKMKWVTNVSRTEIGFISRQPISLISVLVLSDGSCCVEGGPSNQKKINNQQQHSRVSKMRPFFIYSRCNNDIRFCVCVCVCLFKCTWILRLKLFIPLAFFPPIELLIFFSWTFRFAVLFCWFDDDFQVVVQ